MALQRVATVFRESSTTKYLAASVSNWSRKCHSSAETQTSMGQENPASKRRPGGRDNREFQAQSPFVPPSPKEHYGWESAQYTGGTLPRPKSMEKTPLLGLKPYSARKADVWTRKKALFGQNDYIDILGDGKIKPVDTIAAPEFVKGFRGNELQRIVRHLEFAGTYMRDMKPMEYFLMQKRLLFLYKKFNKRKPEKFTHRKAERFADVLRPNYPSRFLKYSRRD